MAHKKWIIPNVDKDFVSDLSEKYNMDPLIAYLLAARGITDELAVSEFLSDGVRLSSPFDFYEMDKAKNAVISAVENGDKICVYGDYDADGVTATSLLYLFLESLGADVDYYIPHREREGYGLHIEAIDKIASNGTKLIVTVDTGINAVEESEYIYSLGMKLVVTDHHRLSDTLPRAEAVINPYRKENNLTFCDFAGVGVAFKLACAVYDGDSGDILEDFSDLVAIGTIGDIVPLLGENRCLVKKGLKVLNESPRLGIEAFRRVSAGSEKEYSSGDVAFQIVPRINAAGRVDSPDRAVKLLVCDDYDNALLLADQLNGDNTHRRELEDNILDDIHEKIKSGYADVSKRVIVVWGDNYHKGVIGIVASHLVEEFSKPAIVISVDSNGTANGSCRGIEGFNIFDSLSYCSDLLIRFGGHPLAGGFSLKNENIELFSEKINEFARLKYQVMPIQCLDLDCKLSAHYLNLELAENLECLEPYGASNQKAQFGLFNFTLTDVVPIGDNKHIRIEIEKQQRRFKVVMFRTKASDFPYFPGDKIDVAVRISKNLYNGKNYLSVQAIDIRLNKSDDDKYFSEKGDFELFCEGNAPKTDIMPTRDICAKIYRFLKLNSNVTFSEDDIYFRFQQEITYGCAVNCVNAFEDCGLVERKNGRIKLLDVSGKVDLMNSETVNNLKRRLCNE